MGHWIIEMLLPNGAWFELVTVENAGGVGVLLANLTTVGNLPYSRLRVIGVDVPLTPEPIDKLVQ